MSILRIKNIAVLTGFIALATASATLDAKGGELYSAGHADVNIFYDSGTRSLGMNYDFGSNAVINGVALGSAGAGDRAADTITVYLNPANSFGPAPAGLPSPFAGTSLYTAPQTSRAGRPFLGIGAETIVPGVFQDDTLFLTLTGISLLPLGGNFVLWQNGSQSTPFFNSADGFSAADQVAVSAGGHDHFTWGFSQQGIYDLNFTASGRLADGTLVSTSAVYQFQVGTAAVPEPGSFTLAGIGLGCAGLAVARRKMGRPAQGYTA